MKIDNMDLTQQFSLSIFTDFRYQSIKITFRLLRIFIDTDFYRLTTPPGPLGIHQQLSELCRMHGLIEELKYATRKNEFIFLHWLMNSLRHRLESWRFD